MSHFMLSLFITFTSFFAFVSANWGVATWYTPNGGLGACGAPSANTDWVIALPANRYYEGNGHCWQHVKIEYNGEVTEAVVVDLCPGCANDNIDVTPAVFEHYASKDKGVINVNWWFI
ncbi:hypothetical protein CYLTODRAFT_425109 [Cylindrobasidium torrendii FP15055 ss-10]|uniref:Uncharacterized protein n=1 Tax=Cylindrobasidium torrendii FP15055 ss-10 TaxID=1314674 RepID=A0A0D7B232_9AGAR|nr:hypothetical protein CYLTODRAFT_425109 [Cylindrobasidium torrendii FP15055 ss-10]